ncbi:MAG: hypothetical protein BWY32_00404 [bacterium ADurb.Bin243]|nr:MAG: hypothetical protein BWY32_00404 [bacterium ADurb.Bin243]
MNKLKALYEKITENAALMSWNEKAMVLCVVFIITPLLYFYGVYPSLKNSLDKSISGCNQARVRFEKIEAEQKRADEMRDELARGEELVKHINSLVMNPDDAVQIINVISELLVKNNISINFLKNNAQFDRIYEKAHSPRLETGEIDQASRFNYKLLPMEFSFRSTPLEYLSFLNIICGFKNLNYNMKKMTASRTNDGKVDVNIILEIIVELNLFTQKNS